MFFEINPSSAVPVYQQLKEQIRRSISSGLLSGESKVPSVRDLALHLRINPNTVAKAYRELELEGVLYTRKGQGTFVSQTQPRVSREDRVRKVLELVDELLLTAQQLGIAPDELVLLVDERVRDRARPGEEGP